VKNLINFFFSFDKLMKEKLVLPFFWLAVISLGLFFFEAALDAISLGPLAAIVNFFEFFVAILLALVIVRLLCELAVAIFRINDNLSPDGGKSETANIDPMAEARKVAEAAAERAREVTKTAGEKTQAARESMNAKAQHKPENVKNTDQKPVQPTVKKAPPSRKTAPKKTTPKTASTKVKTASKSQTEDKAVKAADTPDTDAKASGTAKKAAKPATSTGKKRGPKPGVKVRRDAQGRLLKKDGTLRAKPGPKSES